MIDVDEAQIALQLLRAPDAVPLFVTGAGISVASGIPTFRGTEPNAVWSTSVTEMATRAYFDRNPHLAWAWYRQRFAAAAGAVPNPAHVALAELERRIPATCVLTQNIDGLHHAAGSRNLVEVHGAARKLRCSGRRCALGAPTGFLAWDEKLFASFEQTPDSVPRCPQCGSWLRPHVLWFDEFYDEHEDYGFAQALAWLEQATVIVYVGTSFSVGITALALRRNDVQHVLVDPYPTEVPRKVAVVRAPAEVLFPALLERL